MGLLFSRLTLGLKCSLMYLCKKTFLGLQFDRECLCESLDNFTKVVIGWKRMLLSSKKAKLQSGKPCTSEIKKFLLFLSDLQKKPWNSIPP